MSLINKIKWVLGIALVFLLVLTTNLVDRQNFRVMRDSLEAIYADRLVAQDIIFDLNRQIRDLEGNYLANDFSTAASRSWAGNADQAIQRFAATTLTRQEEEVFRGLKASLKDLKEREAGLVAGDNSRAAVLEALNRAKQDLVSLSAIQLEEGRRELFAGKKAVSSAELFTQLEIGALVVLALCVQVLILYSPGLDRELSE